MVHDFPPGARARDDEASRAAQAVRSYAAFERWMDTQLEELVSRWIHTAAPNASRPTHSWRNMRRD